MAANWHLGDRSKCGSDKERSDSGVAAAHVALSVAAEMGFERRASYFFAGFFWKVDAPCRWKMEKILTFASEMPARKVRVNGAER